jgi:2-polyprenyl-3-methyl-5-hydroxy-6-metoxy-1,4-benzoquinol methylase
VGDLAEAHNRPLFTAVLDAAAAGPGTRLLDVGCGSGLTLVLAAERGAIPGGLDITFRWVAAPVSHGGRYPGGCGATTRPGAHVAPLP